MKVLIIDDEVSTRESIKVLGGFKNHSGVELYEAKNGLEGYQMISAIQPDLVFLDMNMPVMDGADLLHTLSENQCSSKIIVVSGYTDFRYTKAAILKKYVVDYIQKPIEEKQLLSAIEAALGQWEGRAEGGGRNAVQEGGPVFGLFIEDFQWILKKNFNQSMELLQFFLTRQIEHQIPQIRQLSGEGNKYRFALLFQCPCEEPELEKLLERILVSLEIHYGIRAYIVYDEAAEGDFRKDGMALCEGVNYINLNSDSRVHRVREEKGHTTLRNESEKWAMDLAACMEESGKENFDKYLTEILDFFLCQREPYYL